MARERPPKKPGDLQELLNRALAGGDPQVLALLNPFRESLRQYGSHHFPKELRGKIDVSDLIQETIWRAWQSFASFQGKSKKALASWLMGIMRHVIDSHLREYHRGKRDIRREVPLDSHKELINETMEPFTAEEEREEEIRKFRNVFLLLPEPYRQVLYLRKYKELSYKEIAAQIGGTAEGARKLHGRAVKRFFEEWEKSS
jgi:RNA polymerase sigma-70 factor (ECF subfamily)